MWTGNLNQVYPFRQINPWWIILLVSLFIAGFLYFFQPFGLTNLNVKGKELILLGYGAVTGMVLILDLIVIPAIFGTWFQSANWTAWKEILWLTFILAGIGAGNYLYTTGFLKISGGFWQFQMYTAGIGLIPVIIITLVNLNLHLSRNVKQASELQYLLFN